METAVESSSDFEELTIKSESMEDSLPDMLQEVMYEQGVLSAPKVYKNLFSLKIILNNFKRGPNLCHFLGIGAL